MTSGNAQSPDTAPDVPLFSAIITPHRSLSSIGFLVLMAAIGIVSFLAGILFLVLGAWPVVGFFGLDVLLIYWAFRINYRARVVREPRQVLREFGTHIPDDVTVRVHDSLADLRYLVLPRRPSGTEGWSEERLAALVTRDCMVGVANPEKPRAA